MDELKQAHDKLLAEMPEGESHDTAACHLCNPELLPVKDSDERGEMETFTKDELEAAVQAAVAPLQAKIDELNADKEAGEVAQEVAEVTAAKDAVIADLRADLDAKVIEATEATTKLNDTVAFLEAQAAEAEAAEALAALKEARLVAIKEVASFPEDHIAKNIDIWAAMSEDAFASQLETWALLSAGKNDSANEDGSFAETAMHNLRKDKDTAPAFKSGLSAILDVREAGASLRNL